MTVVWKLPTTRKARAWTITPNLPFAHLKADDAEAIVSLDDGSGSVVVYRAKKAISASFPTSGNLAALIKRTIGASES
jgi:hypothetical protein